MTTGEGPAPERIPDIRPEQQLPFEGRIIVALDRDDHASVLLADSPEGQVLPNETFIEGMLEGLGVDTKNLKPRRLRSYTEEEKQGDPPFTAQVTLVQHTPDASRTTGKLQPVWYDVPKDLETFDKDEEIQLTGAPYAALRRAIGWLHAYDRSMNNGQQMHSAKKYRYAQAQYRSAMETIGDHDPLRQARAIRGLASSCGRAGYTARGEELSRQALEINNTVLDTAPEPLRIKAAREKAQTCGVLGRILLSGVVQVERHDWLKDEESARAQEGLGYLEQAYNDLREIEDELGITDQYTINVLSHLSIAQSLYGHQEQGWDYAKLARQVATHSEDRDNPTSADISLAYSLKAKLRAVVRGQGAWAVSRLLRRGTPRRRKLALGIADSQYFGF